MPYQYRSHEGNYCGNIASALTLSLDDSYNEYADSYDTYYIEVEAWKNKSIKCWSGTDIIHWISSVAREMNVCTTDMMGEKFANLDGYQLSCLTVKDFLSRDPIYGEHLYKKLQDLLFTEGRDYISTMFRNYSPSIKVEESGRMEEPVFTRLEVTAKSRPLSPSPPPSPQPPIKKGRGRPRLPRRKKKTEKLGRLWEFLRDLLKNPDYCPSLIAWENYEEGMFRFVHSDKVAKLWGSKKENPDMNYEKLSRAMRYYYKSQVLLPVYGRRLVYKFGPTATGWRVDNPNFAK